MLGQKTNTAKKKRERDKKSKEKGSAEISLKFRILSHVNSDI